MQEKKNHSYTVQAVIKLSILTNIVISCIAENQFTLGLFDNKLYQICRINSLFIKILQKGTDSYLNPNRYLISLVWSGTGLQ